MPTATDPPSGRRRALLRGALAWPAVAGGPVDAGPQPPVFDGAGLLAAWREGAGAGVRSRVGAPGGRSLWLPERPHEVLRDPAGRQAWAVSRRPGQWLSRFDPSGARLLAAVALDDDRRFEGHLACMATGHAPALLDTETDQDTLQGLIAVRDPRSLRLRDEWPSHGIGPHALCAWQGGLAVANGAQLTLAETGRAVRGELFAQAPRANLAWLDPRDGRLRERWDTPFEGASLRHLAVTPDGTLGVALQWPGHEEDTRPLLLLRAPGARDWSVAGEPEPGVPGAQGYAGSVAAWAGGFIVTVPRAGRVMAWDATGRWRGQATLPGAWGLAVRGDRVWVSGDAGAWASWTISAGGFSAERRGRSPGRDWDNHLG